MTNFYFLVLHKLSIVLIMFTKREEQILELIAKGFTSRNIANSLFISLETVKKHRKNMIKKATEKGLEFDSFLRLTVQLTEKG